MRAPLRRVSLACLIAATSSVAAPSRAAGEVPAAQDGDEAPSYAPPSRSYAPPRPSYAPPAPKGAPPPPSPPLHEPRRERDEVATPEADRAVGGTIDPLVPAGIATVVPGAILLVVGASQTGEGSGSTSRTCGLSGCVEVDLPGDVVSSPAMYLGGGGVLTAGGAAMLVAALAAPPDHASPGRARAAGGGLGLSIGAGTVVMGAVAWATDEGSNVGRGLVAVGTATSVISAPVLVWGIVTLDEGEAGDTYTSSGRIVGGSILTSAGLALTVGGTALVSDGNGCSDALCSLGTVAEILPLTAGATGLGVGIPMLIGGAKIAEGEAVPDVRVGAGDVELRWRFQ